MMILHIILKIKNKVKFLIDLLNPCYTTSKHLYTKRTLRVYSYNHTWKKLSLGLGMGLKHKPKAHLQNSDLVGFISRPIHTHETQIWWVSWVWKNGFETYSQTQFFSGVNVWVYYSKFQRKSRAVWRGICAKMFDL